MMEERSNSTVREGGDIFAADMVQIECDSKIRDVFDDANIFITGATGFIGKMFMEKLLRTCPKVKKIYLLLRPKKGKSVDQRFQEIFDGPNMTPLKIANRRYMNQVEMICGDCAQPDLGLDEESKKKLFNEVNFIIHCAATVRFDEKLKIAVDINVRAVKDLVRLAKQMKNLKGFLHVSTAFSNCPRKSIDEVFYDPVIKADDLIRLVDAVDSDIVEAITPGIIGKWPNTYSFTKGIAEDIIRTEAKCLPVAVIRPSIVIASVEEPVAGWIDNLYGPTGVLLGVALGLMRSLHGKFESIAEIVPADYVINCGLSVLWKVATEKSLNQNKETDASEEDNEESNEIPIYNIVSSVDAPIDWRKFMHLAEKHGNTVPSEKQIWVYSFQVRSNKYHHMIAVFLTHTVPAYIVDFVGYLLGKNIGMVKGYEKIHKFSDVISYFVLRTWDFKNNNTKKLWQKIGTQDKLLFPFSMKDFDWNNYFYFYLRGIRVYLLKDPLETIPLGRKKNRKLYILYYALLSFLFFVFYQLMYFLWACLF